MSADNEFYSPLFSKNGLSKSKRPVSQSKRPVSQVSRISLPEERHQEREQYFHNIPSEADFQFSQLALPQIHFQPMLPEEHQQQYRSLHNRQDSYSTDKTDHTYVATDLSNNFKDPINANGSRQTITPIYPTPHSEATSSIPTPTISYPIYDDKNFNLPEGDPKFGKNSKMSRRKLWTILALLLALILLIIVVSVIVVKVNNAAAHNSQSNNDLESNGNGTNPSTNNSTGTNPSTDNSTGINSTTNIPPENSPSGDSSNVSNTTDIPSGSLPIIGNSDNPPTNNTPTVTTSSTPNSCPSPKPCTAPGQILCPPIDGSKCNYYCAFWCPSNDDNGDDDDDSGDDT